MESEKNSLKKITLKTMILGECGVGKTSIANRLMTGKFDKSVSVSLSIETKSKNFLVNDVSIDLQLWDTSGNNDFKSIIRSAYRDATIVLLVFDVQRRETFEKIEFWLDESKNTLSDNCLYILIANKIDLASTVANEECLQFIQKHQMDYFYEISTKTGENFEKSFQDILTKFASKEVVKMNVHQSIKKLKTNQPLPKNKNTCGYCST